MILLGVYREEILSPGKVEEDAAILEATLGELSRRGNQVSTMRAERLDIASVQPDFALIMAQSDRVLRALEGLRRRGTRVINSTSAIRGCYRKALVHLLSKAGIPLPPSIILPLNGAEETIALDSSRPYWLKRGDLHALQPGDVVKVSSREELKRCLDHFRRHGMEEILVQEHVEGEVVKFYGVGPGQYFSAFLLSNGEEVTSKMEPLSLISRRAAEAVGLEIYGGDAVVTAEGDPVLIDLNDWPSFSRCRHPAAMAISRYVTGIFEGGVYGPSVL